MEKSHYLEIDFNNIGVVAGEVIAAWIIEDGSFDHAFGTHRCYDVILDEDEGFDMDDLRFYPYDNEEVAHDLTEEQKWEIEARLPGLLNAPDLNEVRDAYEEI
jgi:hypothetical protein